MMVVITLTSCPPKVRGDLTKWLNEIDTGVFVGNLNSRVRDSVWERVCANIGSGRATMAFSTNNEQKIDFRIHNSDWVPVDYDGIKLVLRQLPDSNNVPNKKSISKIEQQHINRLSQRKKKPVGYLDDYIVIDIETTGKEFDKDHIIEIGAIHVREDEIIESFSALLKCENSIPEDIIKLTGITDEMLKTEGRDIKDVLKEFQEFCGGSSLLGHNIQAFDMRFLQMAFAENGLPAMMNKTLDTLIMSRRKLDCDSFGLDNIANFLGIEYNERHRALADCDLTRRIYEKLKEN